MHRELIRTCSHNRILAESDYDQITGCAERTWDMMKIIADAKQWRVEEHWEEDSESSIGVVHQLSANWRAFQAGGHVKATPKKSLRSGLLYESDEE